MVKGRFITVDGIDGVGKTTQIAYIAALLRQKQIDFITTREPGGTAAGEMIRAYLLATATKITVETETLLLFAARQQHLQEIILPALTAGKWVLCDRFTAATFAYQGGGKGLDPHKITVLENWVQGDFRADLALILDAPPAAAARRTGRAEAKDRFEQENSEFFSAVRNAYRRLAAAEPGLYHLIGATGSVAEVAAATATVLTAVFPELAG